MVDLDFRVHDEGACPVAGTGELQSGTEMKSN